MRARFLFVAMALAASLGARTYAHDIGDGEARYLANEGVLVTYGEAKVLFDPFFHEGFGQYRLVPEAMRAAMFAGEPPYDGVDAIFISHIHADHFSAADTARYMADHPDVILVAPQQAVMLLLNEVAEPDEALLDRIAAIAIDYEAEPAEVAAAPFRASAVRIQHAGGPERRTIENMAYRVTLEDGVTVMHLGDASPDARHYEPHAEHWDALRTDLAFLPYWFFTSRSGGEAHMQRLNAARAVGVHVPANRPRQLGASGADLFTVPGEVRVIEHGHDE